MSTATILYLSRKTFKCHTFWLPAAQERLAFFLACRFWQRYNSLLQAKPILTKSLTSLFGFAIGDILAQLITGQPYNALRTLRLTLFGIVMDGPVGNDPLLLYRGRQTKPECSYLPPVALISFYPSL